MEITIFIPTRQAICLPQTRWKSGLGAALSGHNEAYEMEKFNRGNEKYRYVKRGFYREMGIFMSGLDFLTSIMNVASSLSADI